MGKVDQSDKNIKLSIDYLKKQIFDLRSEESAGASKGPEMI